MYYLFCLDSYNFSGLAFLANAIIGSYMSPLEEQYFSSEWKMSREKIELAFFITLNCNAYTSTKRRNCSLFLMIYLSWIYLFIYFKDICNNCILTQSDSDTLHVHLLFYYHINKGSVIYLAGV